MIYQIKLSIKKFIQSYIWRMNNKHNSTILCSFIPNLGSIKVGNYSYGYLNIESFSNNDEGLVIGSFVSIAANVKFILGGNHQINSFTTYPLKSIFIESSPELDAMTKGKIIVEDEVWIGYGAIILSGVTIGKGAIIAAGSVVVKNIEPYSIVGGNPAEFIKYRFSKEEIAERERININDLSKNFFIKNIDIFYKKNLFEVIDEIKKNI